MNKENPPKAINLRQKAEEHLNKKSSKTSSQLSEEEVLKLYHELQVYQIELDMQSEELNLAKEVAETATRKYTELNNFAPIGYFTLSKEGEIIDLNLSGTKLLGKTSDSLIKSRFGFFVSDDTKPMFNIFLDKVFTSKTEERCELVLAVDGNSERHVQLSGIAGINGKQCFVTILDITELKLQVKELAFQNKEKEKREAELILALEKNEANKIEIDERVKELNGLYSLGILSEKLLEIEDVYSEFVNEIVPNSMQFPENVFVELEVENRKYRNIENYNLSSANICLIAPISLFNKRSGTLTVSYTKNLPFIEFHEQNLINAYGKRISKIIERTRLLQQLLKSKEEAEDFENKFKQIAENIDEVFWLRTDSEMIYLSPSFEKIWGVPCQRIYENLQAFTENIHPKEKPAVQAIFHSNEFKEKGLFNYEYRILRADNQVRWINAKTFPIVDDSGKIIKRVGIASDITEKHQTLQELIQAKERAEESDRLKSAFLANMAHEIRTPMNGILGFSDLLKEPKLTGDQQQEYIRIIEKSGARLLNIINDIVDISKIEAGLVKANIMDANINEKIEYIYLFFKLQVEEKGIKLSFNNPLPFKEAIIRTDNEKFYSILLNLVKNAIKYTDKGSIDFGYEVVETSHDLSLLQFYVKDTGIGIPKDRQSAIFERFVQADIDDKMARQGAGLGLSISKAYVEMLGGKIWVESEEDTGSTFYFTLPYNAESVEKQTVKIVDPTQKEKKQIKDLKILIAEDDETSGMFISLIVKEFSKEIIEAKTGSEAVEMCQKNPDIDLILMDIQMSEMDGYQATQQIRQFNKDVIIIAQTAFGLSGDREKAIKSGCNDYMSKPIKKDELISLIQKYFKEQE